MRPVTRTLTGVSDVIIPVSQYDHGYRVVCDATGTVTYDVNWTNKNVLAGETPFWITETAQAAQTGDSNLFYEGAITAFQLDITAGTGSVEITVSSFTGEG